MDETVLPLGMLAFDFHHHQKVLSQVALIKLGDGQLLPIQAGDLPDLDGIDIEGIPLRRCRFDFS